MLIVTREEPTGGERDPLTRQLTDILGSCRKIRVGQSVVFITEHWNEGLAERVQKLPGVQNLIRPTSDAPLASRSSGVGDTTVRIGKITFGAPGFTVAAGPCAVEDQETLEKTAMEVQNSGAAVLRGGAFKPRTSPHSFQGTAEDGLSLLQQTGRRVGMPVVTEVVDVATLPTVVDHADILQVGARNAQNFTLLRELGRADMPVLLKRGFGCTVDEWLGAAEYILYEGNDRLLLCERGIRTFEHATRFTLDLGAVAAVKRMSHLPVVVDPSHGAGDPELARPLALAAAAAGADGLLIDVHSAPDQALCDGSQALGLADFRDLMFDLERLLGALDRRLTVNRDELHAPSPLATTV